MRSRPANISEIDPTHSIPFSTSVSRIAAVPDAPGESSTES